jgi:hypothetical protein
MSRIDRFEAGVERETRRADRRTSAKRGPDIIAMKI